MYRDLSRSFIVAVLLSGAAFAQTQSQQAQSQESLGDVARAYRAKEQAQEASGAKPKLITNQDVPAPTPIPESDPSDPMTMVSGVKRSASHNDQGLSNRLVAERRSGEQWRSRIQEQEGRIADLQSRIDRVSAAMRASVGSAQYETPVNRYQAVQMERLRNMQEMLAQQQQKLGMMQDAARRAGMDQ